MSDPSSPSVTASPETELQRKAREFEAFVARYRVTPRFAEAVQLIHDLREALTQAQQEREMLRNDLRIEREEPPPAAEGCAAPRGGGVSRRAAGRVARGALMHGVDNRPEPSREEILLAMSTYGGSFVRQLVVLYRLGDADNQRILWSAFQHYFHAYRDLMTGR